MGLMPEPRELEADIEKAAQVADGLAEAVGRGPRHATAAARRLTDEELTLGLAFLAGHPQSTLHVLTITAAWAGWRLWPWRTESRRHRPAWLGLTAGLLGGLALSAAGWLPHTRRASFTATSNPRTSSDAPTVV